MTLDDDLRQAGLPTSLLGCSYKVWLRNDIRIMLDHYEKTDPLKAPKIELMGLLHSLAKELVLTRQDRVHILGAYRRGRKTRRSSRNSKPTVHTPAEEQAPPQNPIEDYEFDIYGNRVYPSLDTVCTVCDKNLDESNTPHESVTSKCTHPRNVCRECTATFIETQFRDKMWDEIQCPSCPGILSYSDMQLHAGEGIFER